MKTLLFIIIMISIIIIGELHLNKKIKETVLLLLSFLYNILLGLAVCFSTFIISFLTIFLNTFSLSAIIAGILFLIHLIPINIYVKRKININTIVYIIINTIAFSIGLFLLWRG